MHNKKNFRIYKPIIVKWHVYQGGQNRMFGALEQSHSVLCSKLSFCQNDSPIACFIDIASSIFMSIHRFLDKGTPGYLESFQNKCRLSPLQIAVDKCDTNSTVVHTNQNSFYKWTKISSLEINIFDLNIMVKSVLDFLF